MPLYCQLLTCLRTTAKPCFTERTASVVTNGIRAGNRTYEAPCCEAVCDSLPETQVYTPATHATARALSIGELII